MVERTLSWCGLLSTLHRFVLIYSSVSPFTPRPRSFSFLLAPALLDFIHARYTKFSTRSTTSIRKPYPYPSLIQGTKEREKRREGGSRKRLKDCGVPTFGVSTKLRITCQSESVGSTVWCVGSWTVKQVVQPLPL